MVIKRKVEYEQRVINGTILNHFNNIHAPEKPIKNHLELKFPNLLPLSTFDTIECMLRISQNKSLALDVVCDSYFRVEIDDKINAINNDTLKRAEMFRHFWSADITNSTNLKESLTGRLIPVNKIHPKSPTVNEYRPIVALSPIEKFLEARFAPTLNEYITLKRKIFNRCNEVSKTFFKPLFYFTNSKKNFVQPRYNPRGILCFRKKKLRFRKENARFHFVFLEASHPMKIFGLSVNQIASVVKSGSFKDVILISTFNAY